MQDQYRATPQVATKILGGKINSLFNTPLFNNSKDNIPTIGILSMIIPMLKGEVAHK